MSTEKRIPSALPVQYRAGKAEKVDPPADGAGPGRFRMSLTSETPVRRYFGNEILKHGKDNIRTQRLESGVVPLLFNHDMDQHLGRVDSYEIKDRTLFVMGEFSGSDFAQEKRRDYDAGILVASSGGYLTHKMTRTEDEDNPNAPDNCDVTDWEPVDASLVTIPADPTVGKRSDASAEYAVEVETISRRSEVVPPATVTVVEPKQEIRIMAETAEKTAAELELARRSEIMAVATDKDFRNHFTIDDAQRAIAENTTADAVKDLVIRKIISANEVGKVGTLGDRTFADASAKERSAYSLTNMLRSLVNAAKPGTFQGTFEAKFEREMSTEIGKRLGKSTTGVFVPLNALTRALGTQAIGSGAGQIQLTSEAAAVETITHPEVIELLRHRPRAQALGARTLGGLQGVVRLPRQSGAGTWQWLGEGAAVTPSDLTMDFISIQPRRGSTQSAVDIELLASTSPDVEGLMRADFNKVRALALDYASINGPLGGPGPAGLLNLTGLPLVTTTGTTLASGGKAHSWADIVQYESLVAAADADAATSGFMFTPEVRAALKTTPMFAAGYAQPIWMPGKRSPDGLEEGPMGYMAGITNQLPKNLTHAGVTGSVLHASIFGDWSQMIFADWGAVEVIYDPYTQAGNGAIVLTMRALHDIAIRHIAAFAASLVVAVS